MCTEVKYRYADTRIPTRHKPSQGCLALKGLHTGWLGDDGYQCSLDWGRSSIIKGCSYTSGTVLTR